MPEEAEVVRTIFGTTETETVWKLFKATYSATGFLLSLEKHAGAEMCLTSFWTTVNTQKLSSVLKNTSMCIFWKGKTSGIPITQKWWKQMPSATKEELEWAYVLTREKFLVRMNKLSPNKAEDWNRYLNVIFDSILKDEAPIYWPKMNAYPRRNSSQIFASVRRLYFLDWNCMQIWC